ncbi:hypothetical protein THIOM_004828 [Candidatus Thiomargarita nelsonii]|uniref:Uncharacterized protein n=1 Tax=Candidatus Thiomargarita nelsonii TaxID=1003181 RepID=A0A176RUW7_9GAMM|nr:hypothetical protein THIOM_004828 [Candidatus Thiomargarita nelsonii]
MKQQSFIGRIEIFMRVVWIFIENINKIAPHFAHRS